MRGIFCSAATPAADTVAAEQISPMTATAFIGRQCVWWQCQRHTHGGRRRRNKAQIERASRKKGRGRRTGVNKACSAVIDVSCC